MMRPTTLAVETFSPLHIITVVVCVLLMTCIAALGRRWRDSAWELRLRRSIALFILAVQVYVTTWWLLPANFNVGVSLPLHICDLAGWLAPLALLLDARWARTLLYFWGFGFSTIAFVTPVLDQGPGHIRFWLFWGGHTLIVGAAVYLVAVLRYRPSGRDLLLAAAVSACYVAAVTPLNLALDVNYGYVGEATPAAPTILDHLGPWPLRIAWIMLIALGGLIALWLPWKLAPSRRSAASA